MPDFGGGYAMNPQQAQMKANQATQGAQPMQSKQPQYPPDHQPAMRVPKGGSSCSSCQYLGEDSKSCTSQYFIQWNGSDQLPAPPDEFCSDWYEPGQEANDAGGGDSGGITDASMSASPQIA